MIRRASAGAVVLTVALLAWSSAAADVVLHDGGVDRDREAKARISEQGLPTPDLALTHEVLSGPAELLVHGAALVPCGGERGAGPSAADLDGVSDLVLSFQLEAALAELARLEGLAACSEGLVPGSVLARLHFLSGASRLDSGDGAGAHAAMVSAAASFEGYEGERGFPQEHLDLLAAARSDSSATRLVVWGPPGTTGAHVNGTEFPRLGSSGVVVPRGRHLVQLETDSGLVGLWIETSDAAATVLFPNAGARIWPVSEDSPGRTQALLALARQEFPYGAVHLLHFAGRSLLAISLSAEDEVTIWQSEARRGRKGGGRRGKSQPTTPVQEPLTQGDAAPDAQPPEGAEGAPPPARSARLRLSVGGGYQFAEPFHYGLVTADIDIRIAGPLEVGVFARPGFTPATHEGAAAVAALVPAGVRVGVRKTGAVSPFVSGAFQIAWNPAGTGAGPILAGAAVLGGVDLAPGDGPFFVRLQGDAGFLGRHFTGRGGAGVGLRF